METGNKKEQTVVSHKKAEKLERNLFLFPEMRQRKSENDKKESNSLEKYTKGFVKTHENSGNADI